MERAAVGKITDRRNALPVPEKTIFQYGEKDLLTFVMAGDVDEGVFSQKIFHAVRNLRAPKNGDDIRVETFNILRDFQRKPYIPNVSTE